MNRKDDFAGERSVLNFVSEIIDDGFAGDLIYKQHDHVINNEVVGGESADAALCIRNGSPDCNINNRCDQSVKNVHEEIGAILPLLRPVDLPHALIDAQHAYPSKACPITSSMGGSAMVISWMGSSANMRSATFVTSFALT